MLDVLGLGESAGKAIAEPVAVVGGLLDKLFTSDDERLTHAEAMERLQQQPYIAQIVLNTTEAQHRSVFVAGWRPFIGWVCGIGLAWHFYGRDLATWACEAFGATISPPQLIGTGDLLTLTLSLLGLGTIRTVEKAKGLAK